MRGKQQILLRGHCPTPRLLWCDPVHTGVIINESSSHCPLGLIALCSTALSYATEKPILRRNVFRRNRLFAASSSSSRFSSAASSSSPIVLASTASGASEASSPLSLLAARTAPTHAAFAPSSGADMMTSRFSEPFTSVKQPSCAAASHCLSRGGWHAVYTRWTRPQAVGGGQPKLPGAAVHVWRRITRIHPQRGLPRSAVVKMSAAYDTIQYSVTNRSSLHSERDPISLH